MSKKDIVPIIDRIVADAQILFNTLGSNNEEVHSISNENTTLIFIGNELISNYLKSLHKLYFANELVEKSVSKMLFEQKFIDLIYKLKTANRSSTIEDFNDFVAVLLALPLCEYKIISELQGMDLESSGVQFGNFNIYHYELKRELLLKNYPPYNVAEPFFERRKSDVYIEINVSARDYTKAVEIAEKYFEIFENVISYMVADIFNNRKATVSKSKGIIKTRMIRGNSVTHIISTADYNINLPADNKHFLDPRIGNDKIWNLVFKKKKTIIESKLMQSIEWIGKGVNDKDRLNALVQFVFAIEAMLKFDSNQIINPSIVSQLSDWLAFILKDDSVGRQEVARSFKSIYGLRSAIVHGGEKSSIEEEVQNALIIAKDMVISFLTKEPYCNMSSMEELSSYINELKFS